MFKRIAIFLVAVAAIFGALYGAYHHGVSVDKARSDLVISRIETQAAADKGKAEKDARDVEQQHAADMAALDSKYTKEISDAKVITESTIADLRTGAVSLRKQLAAVKLSTSATASTGTSTSTGAEAYSPGLRVEDADFLVRLADQADDVVRQLGACQAIVSNDRKKR